MKSAKQALGSWFRTGFCAVLFCVTVLEVAASEVRLWVTNEVIPTYLAAPPSPIPRFYSGRTYQGAKATFYPYPVQDQLLDIKTNKTYTLVYLENDYIKIGVLPELGGRIFSAVDKGNGYNFFYRQHVIKPALIGMLGAWISGGVEWNIPHHHRATSFSPVDYTTVTNTDGSKTIWVGETELRHRMRWLVGMTLYPDRSYLELSCKVFNRTPFAHSMLFWINPAVHCGPEYQVIFPPSTEWAVQHSKPEFASWPIARQVYGGVDYTRGVDISWWKNHPSPVSFFAWNDTDDWFGGYDHGKQAGVIHWADHHVAPGKKFFEWGNGPEGEMWSKVLTDDDGPYLELMAGAWSDNQPDYSWIQPGETREWKHWWYPVRNLGGVQAATRDAAVNLQLTNGLVKVRVNTTKTVTNAEVALAIWKTNVVWTWTTNISPQQPVELEVRTSEFTLNEEFLKDLAVTVAPKGWHRTKEPILVSYQPRAAQATPMPKPVERPKNPKDYASADELYFTGQRVEQLNSPSFEASSYYQEMLRRDSGDFRANTAMGILLCKQWRWEEAAKYLSNAITRATANYIRPKDGEAFYYLGVAFRGRALVTENWMEKRVLWQNSMTSAEEAFQKAVWSPAWQAASYYQLAEIECHRKNYVAALELIERSLVANVRNPRALNLKSVILRSLSRFEDASRMAAQVLAIDPLDAWAPIERFLSDARTDYKTLRPPVLDGPTVRIPDALLKSGTASLLELVMDYANAGFEREAGDIAWSITGAGIKADDPLFNYYAGYFTPGFEDNGYDIQYHFADEKLFINQFPFQFEALKVFKHVSYSRGALADYHLGNLLYDNQPENAIRAWEKARERIAWHSNSDQKDLSALVHRNLGMAYAQHEKNIPKAISSLEKSVELNPKEPRFYYELDVQYEANGTPVQKRLELLVKNHATVTQRDDSLTREILVLMAAGRLDDAIQILTTHRFHNWEGSSDIRNIYVDALLLRGQTLMRAQRFAAALKDFEAAALYPANLEVGRPKRDAKAAQIQYHIALAYEATGQGDKAREYFTKAIEAREAGAAETRYYRGLALQKSGRTAEAKPLFEELVQQGQELLTSEPADYFAKFGEKRSERVRQADAHFVKGLGLAGLGKKPEAAAEFKKALELHPAHVWALSQE